MSAKIWKISQQKAISCGRLPLETQYVFECMFPEGIFLVFVQKDAKKPAILISGRIFTIYSQIIHKPPPPGGMDTAASGSRKKNWKERKEKGFEKQKKRQPAVFIIFVCMTAISAGKTRLCSAGCLTKPQRSTIMESPRLLPWAHSLKHMIIDDVFSEFCPCYPILAQRQKIM